MELLKVIAALKANESEDLPQFRVAMLRNVTLEFPALYLRYSCLREGLRCVVSMGEHDNVMQEVLQADSHIFAGNPNLVILALGVDPLAGRLLHEFNSLTPTQVEEESGRILETFEVILKGIRRSSDVPVLVHSLESPIWPALGVLDSQTPGGQLDAFRELNRALRQIVVGFPACYLVDLDLLRMRVGADLFMDRRFWHHGMAPFSAVGSEALAANYITFIRALTGKTRKCLVLDCDNTLWGGILGEDGFDCVAMGSSYPGSAYRDVQSVCLELNRRGVLLAVCSKNNEEDVLQVFDNHPDMLLRREHFACIRSNWEDKASNLREIARLLNIGLDSLVFVDDSPFEVNLVRNTLPQVEVIHFDGPAVSFAGLIASCGLFDSLILTDEDKRRPAMYRAEASRRVAAEALGAQSLGEYLEHLRMEVALRRADSFTLPRVSQMTMRTNQFNLTTRRYSEASLAELHGDDAEILTLSLRDRYGDLGLVGAAILRYNLNVCVIDTFLLSCRALGRGVENALFAGCAQLALRRDCTVMESLYIPTRKNAQVKDFYPRLGFKVTGTDVDGSVAFRLDGVAASMPSHFVGIETDW